MAKPLTPAIFYRIAHATTALGTAEFAFAQGFLHPVADLRE
jgi:hypothetical protein